VLELGLDFRPARSTTLEASTRFDQTLVHDHAAILSEIPSILTERERCTHRQRASEPEDRDSALGSDVHVQTAM
jgi:hypothetical protein